MDTRALQLCSRFALIPNQLGYCGHDSAPAKFHGCILNGDCEGVRDEITKFIVLYPYLKTIGEAVQKDWYDYDVIEAYWLGSDLLKKIKSKHYDLLLDNLEAQGVPDFLISEMRNKRPYKFIPLHLFNILHVGVGRASHEVVPFNLDSINNCMVRWGEIIELNQGGKQEYKAKIKLNGLIRNAEGKYELKRSILEFPYINNHFESLSVGDVVAVHWKWVVKKLKLFEVENLSEWTTRLVDTINKGSL